jgi:hypothetical protein
MGEKPVTLNHINVFSFHEHHYKNKVKLKIFFLTYI